MINNNLLTVKYDVNKLVFAEYNPRELTQDQHQDLKDSITRFGFVDPLIVNTHKERKNILVGGHQRLKIAKELGYKDVPCVEVDLSPDQEKELNVRLNKNTGQWDWDALANHFDVGELTEWGFSDQELLGDTKNGVTGPEIEITPELYESHNYLVLYFDNDFDWQSAIDVFGIEKTMRKNIKIGDVGEGRVLSGSTVLKTIL